jgi:hypothetical protein
MYWYVIVGAALVAFVVLLPVVKRHLNQSSQINVGGKTFKIQ